MKACHVRLSLALVLIGSCGSACSGAEGSPALEPSTVHAAPKKEALPDGTLVHLEGRFGDPEGSAPWGDASFKAKRKGGKLVRQLELDVVNAPPLVSQDLSLDGFWLGSMSANRKGSLEFEISEEEEHLFPSGFRDPAAGAAFRVGDLMELRLEKLEKLTHLETLLSGPGTLSGKVNFKVERLGDVVSREFQVKVEGAPAKTVHAVTLDGVALGELVVDFEGQGKLEFSTKELPPFPADFPEPHVDSAFQIGTLASGKLEDMPVAWVE